LDRNFFDAFGEKEHKIYGDGNHQNIEYRTATGNSNSTRKTVGILEVKQKENGTQKFGHGTGHGIDGSTFDAFGEFPAQKIGSQFKAICRAPNNKGTYPD
jgi:hypothetical protein